MSRPGAFQATGDGVLGVTLATAVLPAQSLLSDAGGGWFDTDAVTEAVTLSISTANDVIWCITYTEIL